jgi:hypothetical protein
LQARSGSSRSSMRVSSEISTFSAMTAARDYRHPRRMRRPYMMGNGQIC